MVEIVLGVAFGVALGLFLFAVLFAVAMYVWDWYTSKKQFEAEESKLKAEVTELQRQRRTHNQTISRLRRELTETRNKLRTEKTLARQKNKPQVPRPSSWQRLVDE